jgi:hypothetical protein
MKRMFSMESFSLFLLLCVLLPAITVSAQDTRWNLVYQDEAAGTSWYIDTSIKLPSSDGAVRVWIREIYPEITLEVIKEIDCSEYIYRYVGCTRYTAERVPAGPCFDEGTFAVWIPVETDSPDEMLRDALCGGPENESRDQ